MRLPSVRDVAFELRAVSERAPPGPVRVKLQIYPSKHGSEHWAVRWRDLAPEDDRRTWHAEAVIPGGGVRFGALAVAQGLMGEIRRVFY